MMIMLNLYLKLSIKNYMSMHGHTQNTTKSNKNEI